VISSFHLTKNNLISENGLSKYSRGYGLFADGNENRSVMR